MEKKKKTIADYHIVQFQYIGRLVDKKTFRAFVYDKKGEEKLANSYDEFINLTSSGVWFATKEASKERKQKDVVCTTS